MKKINIIFCIVVAFILIGCGEYKIKSNSPDTSRELTVNELDTLIKDNAKNDFNYLDSQYKQYNNNDISLPMFAIGVQMRHTEIIERNISLNQKIQEISDIKQRNNLMAINETVIDLYNKTLDELKTVNWNDIN